MSTNTKKKRGTGAAVVIIVLCLAALCALGYVIWQEFHPAVPVTCLLYSTDAADELHCLYIGGRSRNQQKLNML